MNSPDPHDRIERLTKNIYSRRAPDAPPDVRAPISREEYAVREEWEHKEPTLGDLESKKSSFFKKILIGALVFFFLSVGIAVFMFFGGFNVISSQNVDISVAGPVSVAGGDVLSLDITVQNKNNSDLEIANLVVEYPDGTRSAENITENFSRYRDNLGTIASGKTVSRSVKAMLFGEENSTRIIKVTVEYQVKGSNATFYKEKDYTVTLGASPVSLKVDSLKEVNSNQDVEFKLILTSNSNTVLQNLLLTALYPFGFTFGNSTPSADYNSSEWNIGSMKPGETKTITVRGKIQGQDGEERVLHWNVGIKSPDNEKVLQTTFVSVLSSISIKRPFIGVDLSLDDDFAPVHIAPRGGKIQGEVFWKNNLSSKVLDAEISVKINGKLLDRNSIIPGNGGFFRSTDNTILWNEDNLRDLALINPGAEGSVGFSFETFDLSNPQYTGLTTQDLSISIDVKGNRIGDNNVPEQVVSSATKQIKISSDLTIVPRIAYSVGPFKNTGPVPPKVEKPTTYTVTWTVTNASNDVTNARATAQLPTYVMWSNEISPGNEKVTFNPETNQVVWQIGSVPAKTGYGLSPRQVSFQIEFLPSLGQVRTAPTLVGAVSVTAHDVFVNKDLSAKGDELNTRLNDPKYSNGSDVVTQ